MADVRKLVNIDESERESYISRFLDELPVLRVKLGLSQDELAGIVGISRQTYCTLETRKRNMSWSLFLALIFIFDRNPETRDIMIKANVLPDSMMDVNSINGVLPVVSSELININDLDKKLDDKAIHAIETVVMMEYARCSRISGEAVIKAFAGRKIVEITSKNEEITKAIKKIKSRTSNRE